MASVSGNVRLIDTKCRICMFPKQNLSSLFNRGLSMKVMKLAEIKMYEGDGLPSTICLDCELEVNRCVNFIGQIQRADVKLRQMLQRESELPEVYKRVQELGKEEHEMEEREHYMEEREEEMEEREQEASTSQIDIEEFNVKQEITTMDHYLDEGTDPKRESDSDNHFEDESLPLQDESLALQDESLALQPFTNNYQPEDERVLNPLNHVDVMEDGNRPESMEVHHDPLGQEEPLIEPQKIESFPFVDPLTFMKQEEGVSMDIDKNNPEPCASSSTVKTTAISFPIWPQNLSEKDTKTGQKQIFSLMLSPQEMISNAKAARKTKLIPLSQYLSRNDSKSGQLQILKLIHSPQTETSNTKVARKAKLIPLSEYLNRRDSKSGQLQVLNLMPSSQEMISSDYVSGKTKSVPQSMIVPFTNPISQNECNKISVDSVVTLAKKPIQSSPTKPQCKKKKKPRTKISQNLNLYEEYKNKKNEQMTLCIVCNIEFGFSDLRKEHEKKEGFICRICTLEIKNHTDLEAHFFTHKPYKCMVCQEFFISKKDLGNHKKVKHPNIGLSCEICNRHFTKPKSLRIHKLEQHSTTVDWHKCVVCAKSYRTMWQLRHHLTSTHVVYELLSCKFCHLLFLGPNKLKDHVINSHLGDSAVLSCKICGKVYDKQMSLYHHMMTHDDTESLCEVCGTTIKGAHAMKYHMKRFHSEEGTFACRYCNKQFKLKLLVRRHHMLCGKNENRRILFCEICGKQFKRPYSFRVHKLIHSDDRRYKCKECGAAFKQAATLSRHKRVHSSVTRYCCNKCGITFKYKATFNNHVKKCASQAEEQETTCE